MDECRKRLRNVGRKGVEGSSSDFYFASLDGSLVLDAGKMALVGWIFVGSQPRVKSTTIEHISVCVCVLFVVAEANEHSNW